MNSKRTWSGMALGAVLGGAVLLVAREPVRAQQQDGGQRSLYAGMEHTGGEIAAVNGMTLTVKTEKGALVQIVTTTNTRVMRGRGITVKVADLKVGDGVVAIGNLDGPGGTMHAAMVFATDPAQLKALKDNLGKTYIVGKVTAIDTGNATLTIERPDSVSQTIQLDETTSIRRGGRGTQGVPAVPGSPEAEASAGPVESLTMNDLKVGDAIRGTGAVKGGAFVPAQLILLPPGGEQGGRHRTPAGTPPA